MDKSQIIIAIEGIDGAGKTTLISEICRYFGDEVVVYRRTSKGKILDKLVSSRMMQKHYMLQIPIYLYLSYKNYFLFKLKNRNRIIIMDRCFLSNVCYFFPNALHCNKLLKKLLFFEIKLFPQMIFIIDVNPEIGQIRDYKRKSLEWLKKTRKAYLEAENSNLVKWVSIEVIRESLSVEEKCNIIINYIKGEKVW